MPNTERLTRINEYSWQWNELVGGPADGETMSGVWNLPTYRVPVRRPTVYYASNVASLSDVSAEVADYSRRRLVYPDGVLYVFAYTGLSDEEAEYTLMTMVESDRRTNERSSIPF